MSGISGRSGIYARQTPATKNVGHKCPTYELQLRFQTACYIAQAACVALGRHTLRMVWHERDSAALVGCVAQATHAVWAVCCKEAV